MLPYDDQIDFLKAIGKQQLKDFCMKHFSDRPLQEFLSPKNSGSLANNYNAKTLNDFFSYTSESHFYNCVREHFKLVNEPITNWYTHERRF